MKKSADATLIKPAATRAFMALAAALVLAGGIFLARRTVFLRAPADRQLLGEVGAALQRELLQLDQQFLAHLRRVANLAWEAGSRTEAVAKANEIRSLAAVGVFPAERGQKHYLRKLDIFGETPPELRWGESSAAASVFQFPVPSRAVFDGPAETAEGWIAPPNSRWMAWWLRKDAQTACVILISKKELAAAISEELERKLPGIWAPVRAAGGLNHLVEPAGRNLAGKRADTGPPDFLLPLAGLPGTWQIESWDRWQSQIQWEPIPLALASVLSLALLLLGFRVADQQRRALKEAASRVSFVNQVSHELGTPLTNLRLNLELASELIPEGPASAMAQQRLDIVRDESLRLSWLVENVLQRARQEKGTLQLLPTLGNAAETAQTAVERFLPNLHRRGFTVETDFQRAAEPSMLDHAALSQIVINLLSNVEKYALGGQWVRISLAQTSDSIVLQVADHGPGVRQADADRIFQPFTRLQSTLTEGASGTGLGLAIVRELAERMGGAAMVLNPGDPTGAVFQVTLPHSPSLSPTA